MRFDDPFMTFCNALAVALTIYYTLTIGITVWQIAAVLHGHEPHKRLLRVYFSYLLLTVRLRPLAGELIQIAFWGTILLSLWWLHLRG